MKVITIAAPKGGCGKSTAALVLAARAVQDGKRVAMFDMNADQASLTQWWFARGEPDNPALFEVNRINDSISEVAREGFDWLIIDTPPQDINMVEHCVIRSNVVVIPVRSSLFDIGAIEPVIEMAKKRRRPHSFLMSAVDTRDGKHKKLNEQSKVALASIGPIFNHQLQYHSAYISALISGKTGFEVEKKLQTEVDGLWNEVQLLADTAPPIFYGRRYDRLA